MHKMVSMLLIFGVVLMSPAEGGQVPSEHPAVYDEIRQVLDNYREAMLTRDYDAMLSFWSDSEDFIFAGDGRILGGLEAWKAETTRHYEQTRRWEQWEWQSVHILPLSDSAASATLEFRFRWIDSDGVTHNSRGAWTYVFVKSDGAWKVIHTNGTHVEL